MRPALAAALVLLSPFSALAQPDAPLTDDPTLLALLTSLRLEETDGIDAPPADAIRRQTRGGDYHVSPDGRSLYITGHESGLWRVDLIGPALPTGSRLVPVVDLTTVRFASMPDEGYALLIPGQDRVFIADWRAISWSLPIEPARRGTIAQTQYVRAMRACPHSRAQCALVGTPSAVRAAVDPVAPNHGWNLVRRSSPELHPGLSYQRRELPTAIDGAAVVVDRGAAPDGDRVDRVFLRLGGRTQHAFDRTFTGSGRPLEPGYAAVQIGRRVYVHDHWGTVSTHDATTGRRIGEPLQVRLEPYYEICLAGDDGFTLVPVLGPRGVAFAMVILDGPVYLFEGPGGDSVRRQMELGVDDDELWNISFFERRGRRLTPRIVVRQ